MWDETTAQKGSNEINSCLYKWFQENKSEGFRHLRIFSDNCVGQNKNLYVILNCMRMVQSGELDSVTLEFMVAGHSYLPCDSVFGNIEKKLQGKQKVNCPDEYMKIIRDVGPTVYEMKREDFFNFKGLKALVTERKPKDFNFTDGRTFKITKDNPWSYQVSSKGRDEIVSLLPNKPPIRTKGKSKSKSTSKSQPDLSQQDLELAYHDCLRLDPSKLQHLNELGYFLDEIGKAWLTHLNHTQESSQEPPPNVDEETTEDPELLQDQDLLDYCPNTQSSSP